MKMFMFKMLIIVGVLLAVPYFIMGGGKMPDFLQGMFESKPDKAKLPENIASVKTDKDVKFYKWVDENGIVHFSGTKPTGKSAEEKHLRADTNIMKAVKLPEEEAEEETKLGGLISLRKSGDSKKKSGGKDKDGKVEPYEMENPYTAEGMKNLIEGAKNVQGLVDQRSDSIKDATGR